MISSFAANFVFMAFAVWTYFIVPIFMGFADFNVELPIMIQFLIPICKYLIIPPIIVLAILSKMVLKKENAQKLKVYLLISFGIAGVIIVLLSGFFAMISPGGMGEIN